MSEVKWEQKSFGYEAVVGEGALRLIVFYEHGWKVGINDRVVSYDYSTDVRTCKRVAINWARQKLKIMESELRKLETLNG